MLIHLVNLRLIKSVCNHILQSISIFWKIKLKQKKKTKEIAFPKERGNIPESR